MKQKLIFLDIDGTLLPPGEMIVPESAVDAIHLSLIHISEPTRPY